MAKLNGKLLKIFELSVKKYGIAELAKKTLTDVIARFSVNDPSGTNKYVQLMIDIMMNESKREIEIIDLIKKFHSVEHKISSKIFPDGAAYKNKKISENPKDIQNYETFKDLLTVYTLANNYVTKKESSNKIVDEETDVIYDGEDYIIVSPLTFQSSCYWGVDTKWCTTTKNEPRYFDDYTKNGTLLYVIDKYRQNDRLHPMSKFALHIRHGNERDGAEIFNRPDNPMGRGMEKVLPDFIIKKLM